MATAFFASSLALPARADVEATSTTVLTARPEIRAGQAYGALPLIELLGLSASGFDNPWVTDARVRVSAWGELRPSELPARGSASGDVDLAFAEGKLFEKRLRLTLGRQFVFGGGARSAHLDGASGEVRLSSGLGLLAYGGATVVPRFAVRRGDALAGARAFWSPSFDTELGVSFIQVLERGLSARQDLGVDGRWEPSRDLTVAGHALYSLAERRLAELDLGPRWQIGEGVEVSALYRRTSPDLFLPRSSIFSVFAEQSRDEAGAGILWHPRPRLGLYADWRAVWVGEGLGTDAGGQLTLGLGPLSRTRLSAQARVLQIPGSGYVRARATASHRLPSDLSLALDADWFLLDRPVNGERMSIAAAAVASWPFAPEWLAALSVGAGSTPTFQSRFEVLAKVGYRFSTRAKETAR